jgi:hypothetical protein
MILTTNVPKKKVGFDEVFAFWGCGGFLEKFDIF